MTTLAPTALLVRQVATSDRAALQRMLELYQYELSDIWDQDLDADGMYGYALERYWQTPGYTALVACVNGFYAGFALVDDAVKLGPGGHWMDQFFVLKKYRRMGVGQYLANYTFDLLPGSWEVGQMTANHAAHRFWRHVIAAYTGADFVEQTLTEGWWQGTIQRFDSPGVMREPAPG